MFTLSVCVILCFQVSQDAVVNTSNHPEVIDVVVKNKGRKGSNDVAPRERKSRVMSTDWLAMCDSLGEGQD